MENNDLASDFYSMRFDLERTIRYWSARATFWTAVVQAATVAVAISGSAAVATVFPFGWWALGFAAFAALCGILASSFDAPSRVRFCTERIALYTGLLARCPIDREKESPELLAHIRTEYLRNEATEPIVLECLSVICHNKTCRALGRDDGIWHLTLTQRTIGRIFPIPYKKKSA